MNIASTLTVGDAAARCWDVLVIGAGPAGALAALQSARMGLGTLLVESKRMPRDKVCGGCMNERALAILRQEGLGSLAQMLGAQPLSELCLLVRGRVLRLPMPYGQALSRAALDGALVQAAIAAGAEFLCETQASVCPAEHQEFRQTCLRSHHESRDVAARLVLCADGVNRSSLKRLDGFQSQVAPHSRIGVSALLDEPSEAFQPGRLTMVVGGEGYVGLTRVEGGRLNVAAAVSPRALHGQHDAGEVISSILSQSQVETPAALATAHWHGTAPLTSRPGRVADERLLVLGDAGGYVEPFTGEGIAWAMETSIEVGQWLGPAVQSWQPSLALDWQRRHRALIGRRQLLCKAWAAILCRPRLSLAAIHACRVFPTGARFLMARINSTAAFGRAAASL